MPGYTITPAVLDEDASWQACVSFPDWCGFVQKSLAVNSVYGYIGCRNQGELYLCVHPDVLSFDLFINNVRFPSEAMHSGTWRIDTSSVSVNGINTLQISNIEPWDLNDAVIAYIPFPVPIMGMKENEPGMELLDEIIAQDIQHGFPSASICMIRHGEIVYEKAWGRCCSTDPASRAVSTDTLYDLASVTKVFAVNYPLQKYVSDGVLDIDTPVHAILGSAFYEDVIMIPYRDGAGNDLPTQKAWKKQITLHHLLTHSAGFPPDARYYYRHYDAAAMRPDDAAENILYTGCDGSRETRSKTIEALNRTPLLYEPGTRTIYSDTDYMILGAVLEKVSGKDLDTLLKDMFLKPMGLTHMTFRPLDHGFVKADCAATELHGNTRDGARKDSSLRNEVLQGEVHDEKAWYSMAGISGHAGLFASARDAAALGMAMLYGGYGTHRFFTKAVMDTFVSPSSFTHEDWGLGWFRNGDHARPWHFSGIRSASVFGHQGWTGTLLMIDPAEDTVLAVLTNAKNTPVSDPDTDSNLFDGDWYSASGVALAPQLLAYKGSRESLNSLAADMANEAIKRIPKDASPDHPSVRNTQSKLAVLKHRMQDDEQLKQRYEQLSERLHAVLSD